MSATTPTWRSAVLPRPQTYLGQKTVCLRNTFLSVLEPDDDHHMKRCASSPELTCGHSIASVASAKHAMNICKPCHYFASKAGCKHGRSCSFCHHGHARKATRDIPKSQRAQCLQHVAAVHRSLPGSIEKVLAERQLLAWLTSDSRIGAYTFKALRSFQGPSTFRADVLEFSEKATAFRRGRKIADIEPCPDQAELACFAHGFQTL